MLVRATWKYVRNSIFAAAFALAALVTAAAPASALISVDEIFVGYDAFYIDGTFGSYAFEVEMASFADEVTDARIRLPDGSTWVDLLDDGDGEWSFFAGGYATEGDRNTGGYTSGTYRIEFTGTASEVDFIDVLFSPTDPVGFADLTSHSDGQTGVSLNPTLTWTCAGCTADSLAVGVTDAITDNDVIFIDGLSVGSGSLGVGPLDPLTDYLFETEIVVGTLNAGVLSDGGLTLDYYEESYTVNLVDVTTVPEPGTAALLAVGLVGLAQARRHRSRRI